MGSVYIAPGNRQFTRNIYNTNQLTPTKMGHVSGAIASKGYHADRTVIEWESVGTFDQFAISRKVPGTDTTNWKIIKTVPGASVFTNYQESDETGLAGVIYDYKIVGSLMCSKQLITSNPVTNYGFRTPTGDFYGRVTFEHGHGEDSVMVRLESDAI